MSASIDIIRPLYWEYVWSSVLERLESPFVISRVLEFGRPEQFEAFATRVGHDRIKTFIGDKGRKLLSPRSFNFWSLYYGFTSSA